MPSRNEDAQSPRSKQKKDFTPFRAWSAVTDDSGGSLDEGRIARLRDTAASAKLFLRKSKNLPNNGIIENLTFRITPKLKMTFGPVWLAHTGLFYWLESSEELARLSLSTSA